MVRQIIISDLASLLWPLEVIWESWRVKPKRLPPPFDIGRGRVIATSVLKYLGPCDLCKDLRSVHAVHNAEYFRMEMLVDSWSEHLRQHARITKLEKEAWEKAASYHLGQKPVRAKRR